MVTGAHFVASPTSTIRRALLLMSRPYVAPRTPIERKLAEIWCEVLDIDCVGINDDYIDLGGDSVMAVVLISMIVAEFSVSMPTATIIRAPTIAQLAQKIDGAKRASFRPRLRSGRSR